MSFQTYRDITANPATVFAAFTDGARLARWWGPAGFSNSFEIFEFKPGGRWVYVMHGPGGKNYPNESAFVEITPAQKVVIQHVSQPHYRLTITLTPTENGGTRVHWEQIFADPRVAQGIAHIVVPANDQNLERLSAEVLNPPSA